MTPQTAAAETAAATPLPGDANEAPREFLAYRLGADEYALDILRVQEIRAYEAPTRIAGAADCVLGVVNLRGVIVPVVDLRRQLRLPPAAADACTVLVVLHIGHRLVGLVVDAVSDVVALAPEQWRELPALKAAEHLLALGAVEQRLLMLLDVDRLLGRAGLGPAAADPAAAPGRLQ